MMKIVITDTETGETVIDTESNACIVAVGRDGHVEGFSSFSNAGAMDVAAVILSAKHQIDDMLDQNPAMEHLVAFVDSIKEIQDLTAESGGGKGEA